MTNTDSANPKTSKTKNRKPPNTVRSLGKRLEAYLNDHEINDTVPVGEVLAEIKEDAWNLDS